MMLNLAALQHAVPVFSNSNYLITDLINVEYQNALINQFPQLSFFEVKKDESHAHIHQSFTFRFITTNKIDNTNLLETKLSTTWHRFIQAITYIDYIKSLSELVKIDLTEAKWSFELACYRNGDWLGAHYDQQKNKILTQLFYFNHYWDITWGGHLHILHPDDHSITILTVPPTINYSVITLTKSDAWHKVSKIQQHTTQPRLVMGLQFFHAN